MKRNSIFKRADAASIVALAFVFLATRLSAPAATLYVDSQIASTTCAAYNPATRSCDGGTDTAYRAIAAASAAAQPGDTILIRGGAYAEQLRPANSGAPGEPITYQAYPSETVLVGGGSAGTPGMLLSDRSHIVIDGLRVEDRAWCEARNTHHTILRNCVFLRTPASGTTGNVRFISATFNQILDCTFLEGNDNLVLIDANNNLVQGCTIGEGRHSVIGIRCGDFNIIRANYFYNSLQKIGEVYDCATGTSAVPTMIDSTSHNIFEDNIFANAARGSGQNDTTSNGNAIQYAGQEGIIRRNLFFQCTVGLGMAVYADEALHNENNRVYHNVFYANKGSAICPRSGNFNAKYKNNILFQNGGCINGCEASTSPGQIVYRTDLGPQPFGIGTVFENNDIIFQQPGQAVMEVEFGSGQTLAQFNAAFPGILLNTFEADPQFENAATNNFRLRPTSPMIDAGAFLTRTLLPGVGTLLPVGDAFYFCDGFGIAGEPGDLIQLEGQSETARVLQVDYMLNTLLLDRPLIWGINQGVSLAFNGAAPDIGVFEADPTQIRVSHSFDGATLHLSWPPGSGYTLVASENVTGPYSPIVSADGTYSESTSSSSRFFQLRKS